MALPLQPIHLTARVRNNTTTPLNAAQATLQVNDDARPVLLPDIAPGAITDVPLTLSLDNPGDYAISFSLPHDALAQDDTRHIALSVRPTLSVLLVDGAPSSQPFDSETDYLQLAYTIGAPALERPARQ